MLRLMFASLLTVATPVLAAQTVNIYNWADYVGGDTLETFQQQTGIAPHYSTYPSNEALNTQLNKGTPAYDVVFPSNHYLPRQIKAGVLQPLDRTRLPNWKYLNPTLLRVLEANDPGNRYGIPYLWGSSGIGYNVDKVRAVLGDDAPVDSWALLFKPGNIARLSQCGVAMIDNGPEMLPIALNYLGLPTHSTNPADYRQAQALLMTMRPHVRYFDSVKYGRELAEGKVCVVVGFSGDVLQARSRAQEAGKGVKIAYSIPREGSVIWFDMAAIPANASNLSAAYAYLNFLLEPQVIADITNSMHYANGNEGADDLVRPAIRADNTVYPSAQVMSKLFTLHELPPDIDQLRMQLWQRFKAGAGP